MIRKFSVGINARIQYFTVNWSGEEISVFYLHRSDFSNYNGNNSDRGKMNMFSLLRIQDMTLLELSRMAVLKSDGLGHLGKAYMKFILGIY